MSLIKTRVLPAVAGVALLATGVTGVFAQSAPPTSGTTPAAHAKNPNRVVISGTLASSGNGTLTITTKTGAVTVQVNATTRYVVNGQKAAAAPTFTANEKIRVIALKQADGSLVASVVATGTAARQERGVAGTVASSTDTTLTITPKTGAPVTVTLTANTRYVVNGQKAAARPTFTQGERVRVLVQKTASGALEARTVAVGAISRQIRIGGTVTGFSGDKLTVTTRAGKTFTVQLTAQTRYVVDGKKATAAPTFALNSSVFVLARKDASGNYVAVAVSTGKNATLLGLTRVRGAVSSFTGTALTVTNKAGKSLTFQVTAQTRFVVNGQKAATAPALTSSQTVVVTGRKQAATNTYVALAVRVVAAR
jgi:frataxin-like iron-binding protein CyaY